MLIIAAASPLFAFIGTRSGRVSRLIASLVLAQLVLDVMHDWHESLLHKTLPGLIFVAVLTAFANALPPLALPD